MTAEELFLLLKEYSNVSLLIDIKWDNYDTYKLCVDKIENLICFLAKNETEKFRLKEQIVLEVYDEVTIRIAYEKKYYMFFTQYRNPEMNCLVNTVNLCYKYGIRVIGLWPEFCYQRNECLKTIIDKNIKIFVFSSDSIEEYMKLIKIGVKGIFTNYLSEKDIKNELIEK